MVNDDCDDNDAEAVRPQGNVMSFIEDEVDVET